MIKYYAFAAALAIVLYIIYIPTYSYYAAAAVTVLAELLIAVAAFVKVWKTTKFSLSFTVFNKTVIGGLVMGFVLYILSGLHILILVPIGVMVYVLFILMTKATSNVIQGSGDSN
jgi:hypothetical protein